MLSLIPALFLQLSSPTTQYAYAVAPVLRLHRITVIEGCPSGLDGLFRPLERTLCFAPSVMDGDPAKAVRLMAHEITHVAQWCQGRALAKDMPALEAEAYRIENNPTLALRNLYTSCSNNSPP